jgi:diadenosine tetraphosphatase ApaH/serine/threonine PP2A family protein phosphatase
MRLTKRGQAVASVAIIAGLLGAMGIAGAIETQPVPATDEQCNDIYHAVYILENNPARIPLIHLAFDLGCPFEDGDGNYVYTWEAMN